MLESNTARTACGKRVVGIKLDFKSPAAVESCLKILNNHRKHLCTTPVWLNADIWNGPGGKPSPFDADLFIGQCVCMLKVDVCFVICKVRLKYTVSKVKEKSGAL